MRAFFHPDDMSKIGGVKVQTLEKSAMSQALTLARSGYGLTFPNPIVGCVITDKNGIIVGEGFHHRNQSPDHAEIVAIKNSTSDLTGSTMYVTLEPCNHTGVTPACTEAIIKAKISKVVIASRDPHSIAAGGIERLQSAGIDVESGVLDEVATFDNRSWLHKIKTGRPRIIWKLALSSDGKIALGNSSPVWVTSKESRADVQLLRAQSDAIMIGTGTALADNPHLIPQISDRRHTPDRIVVGSREIPSTFNLHDKTAATTFLKESEPSKIIELLISRGYNQVLVESGPTLGMALFKAGFIDELAIYRSPDSLAEKGIATFENSSLIPEDENFEISLINSRSVGLDTFSHYFIKAKESR
jgi:diaminohydroxyphosphoribosylaminopyrimidine deaminase/5-amino-6-(5-phosphoribosylamino)uracil reductase